MKNKKYLAIPMVIMLGMLVLSLPSATTPVNSGSSLKYDGVVCVYKNNQLVECKHNLITNVGLNAIKTQLGVGTPFTQITNISVANATGAVQAATDTTLTGEWKSCGLAGQGGTYVNQAGNGQWNITYQWTVAGTGCADILVNATGLYNATGASQLFAEVGFTAVTLQTNDKINVTWGLVVS